MYLLIFLWFSSYSSAIASGHREPRRALEAQARVTGSWWGHFISSRPPPHTTGNIFGQKEISLVWKHYYSAALLKQWTWEITSVNKKWSHFTSIKLLQNLKKRGGAKLDVSSFEVVIYLFVCWIIILRASIMLNSSHQLFCETTIVTLLSDDSECQEQQQFVIRSRLQPQSICYWI